MLKITIYADVPVTRRIKHHLVMSDDPEPLWRGSSWTDCMIWLYHNDIERFTLDLDGLALDVTLTPLPAEKEPN